MRYPRIDFDPITIKQQIIPYDFYVREQDLVRCGRPSNGWIVAGLCPFHDDQFEGSFYINLVTGGFKCHSCGEGGGDIISYIRKKYQLGFKQAMKKLMTEWGMR